MSTETRTLADPVRTALLDTAELRENFLVERLFAPGEVRLVYTSLDRMIVGSVVPADRPLELVGGKELAADHFAQRREVGILNLGSPGKVIVDGEAFAMASRDGLYIGRGAKRIAMGITSLAAGSVWNTMPAHTHARRIEAYLYFDLAPDAVVFHYLGTPRETRHLVVRDGQVALSPSWSIHCGCGTANYSFVWAMGGENQQFDDMDPVAMDQLK